ncbi:hypothetical protein RhiirA4_462202 [Rhizophagus irregularis]|uniref:Uncharacterized protein n=1 Tax=Rhizophagus irregularis TaxID=588596 RepID=A0A2I1GKH0_9GLOM|nr:hypothetical protein RhiirA4_462202 [Rhizophagus irregularis]
MDSTLNSLQQNNTHVNNVISAQQTSPYIYQSPVQTTLSTYSGQGNTNYNIASTHQNVNFSNQYDPMSIQQTFQTSIQTNSLTHSPNQNPPVHLKNDYLNVFFYKQRCNNQIYQVSCKIVSPSFLNKNFYGTETEQNISQEKLAFSLHQKEILEQDLTLYLSYHLLD